MTARRYLAAAGSLSLLSLGIVGVALPASAAPVTCGQTITVSTVLDGNVGPCATGVTIGADNVTLDLKGFTISGNPTSGDGPGINLVGRTGVTIKNGTVTQFDAGVAITGGSANTVIDMTVVNNRGNTVSDFGDGIAMFQSNANHIVNNEVRNNGPYDGIGMVTSNFNVIDGNKIYDNNQSPVNTAGIRIENSGQTPSSDNTVINNQVVNSGTFGIEVFAGGSRNLMKGNQVVGSAIDGIVVFAGGNDNVIQENTIRSNRGNGISIRGAAGAFAAPMRNSILRNASFGNVGGDLRDAQPTCGTNEWHGNQGAVATPPCTLNP